MGLLLNIAKNMVLVSKAERRAIFAYLLREGVIVVRKDSYLPVHQHIPEVSNLKVMMVVKSLKSSGYLNDIFNWQWCYYTVTNKGVAFLAKSLGVSADVVPSTYKKRKATAGMGAPKMVGDEEGKPAAEATEGETPFAGMGRGAR